MDIEIDFEMDIVTKIEMEILTEIEMDIELDTGWNLEWKLELTFKWILMLWFWISPPTFKQMRSLWANIQDAGQFKGSHQNDSREWQTHLYLLRQKVLQ